jgi:hypothetical protein
MSAPRKGRTTGWQIGDLFQRHCLALGNTVTMAPLFDLVPVSKGQYKSAILVNIVPSLPGWYGEMNNDIVVRLNASILDVDDDRHLLGSNARVDTDLIASQYSNTQSTPHTGRPPT